MKSLHVCIIASQNIRDYIGGIRTFTLSAVRWLSARNVRVSLVYRDGGLVKVVQDYPHLGKENEHSKVSSYSRGFSLPSHLLYQTMQLFFCFLSVISIINLNKRRRVSLIHAQDTHYGALISIIAGKLLKVPTIIHAHGSMYIFNVNVFSRGIQLVIHNLVLKHSSLVISVSEATKRWLISQFQTEPSKVSVLTIGANTAKFTSNIGRRLDARRMLGIDEEDFVIGYFGRLSVQKNVESLIISTANILNSSKAEDILLLIVGKGEEEPRLKSLAKELGIEQRTLFTGYIEDLPLAIQAMDIFVLPSFLEGYPTVLLEAMAAGLGIIVSDIPGIREIITDGKTGLLINPKIEEIKESILVLYNNPELRGRLAKNALSESPTHEINRIFQQLFKTYRNLITENMR